MAEQKQDDQHEHTFSNYVRIQDVVQKTWQRRWMIGKSGERGSGISVLLARHDDDDNAISTHYIKVKNDNMQQNSKCRLCRDRDERVYHIISECSKLAQKEYKTKHDWIGIVIHWELCKRLKFHNNTKGYMHKPKSVQEDKTHKILCDFEIQADHFIAVRKPDFVLINKKKRISFNNCKNNSKRTNYINAKMIICNRIASVG